MLVCHPTNNRQAAPPRLSAREEVENNRNGQARHLHWQRMGCAGYDRDLRGQAAAMPVALRRANRMVLSEPRPSAHRRDSGLWAKYNGCVGMPA